MFTRIKQWFGNKVLTWAAPRIGMRLGLELRDELRDLAVGADRTPGKFDDTGVAVLRGIVDADVRTAELSRSLTALADYMAERARKREGKLDDAMVVVLRSALHC